MQIDWFREAKISMDNSDEVCVIGDNIFVRRHNYVYNLCDPLSEENPLLYQGFARCVGTAESYKDDTWLSWEDYIASIEPTDK